MQYGPEFAMIGGTCAALKFARQHATGASTAGRDWNSSNGWATCGGSMTNAAGNSCPSLLFCIFREYMSLSARPITSVGLSKRRNIVTPAEAPTELKSVAKRIFMALI